MPSIDFLSQYLNASRLSAPRTQASGQAVSGFAADLELKLIWQMSPGSQQSELYYSTV